MFRLTQTANSTRFMCFAFLSYVPLFLTIYMYVEVHDFIFLMTKVVYRTLN